MASAGLPAALRWIIRIVATLVLLPMIIGGVKLSFDAVPRSNVVLFAVAAVFTALSVGFLAIAFWLTRNPSPGSTGTVRDASLPAGTLLWTAAVLWLTLTSPVWMLMRNGAPVLIAVIIPLIGVTLLSAALYRSIRLRKYGSSRCRLETLPAFVGGKLAGEIETNMGKAPAEGFALELLCIRSESFGRSRTDSVLWQERLVAFGEPSANGLRVPFAFTIPRDAAPSGGAIVWRLDVRAETPGVDYAAEFEVPVVQG
jgi:hypothetical protein